MTTEVLIQLMEWYVFNKVFANTCAKILHIYSNNKDLQLLSVNLKNVTFYNLLSNLKYLNELLLCRHNIFVLSLPFII